MNEDVEASSSLIQRIVSLIDLTNLNDDCDEAAIEALCKQANTPVGCVAAVCIWPAYVAIAKKYLDQHSSVSIATVANFPSGNDTLAANCETIRKALEDGANEIDYVLPYKALMNGETSTVASALKSVRSCVPDNTPLKVILESGVLDSAELISKAAHIAIDEGADFIKTSTGKVSVNATPEAADIMLEAIASANKNVGFKAAGGIKTVTEASTYLALAENRFGPSWITASHFRFGASSLLQNALVSLDGVSPAASGNSNAY